MFYNLTKQLFIPLENAVIMDEYERDIREYANL